jgi:hypothetical protein
VVVNDYQGLDYQGLPARFRRACAMREAFLQRLRTIRGFMFIRLPLLAVDWLFGKQAP